MADISDIDLVSLIEQESPARFGKPAGTGSKRTVKGACPWCGGTDRFAVFTNEIPMRYYCGIHGHGCGQRGDAITFVREYIGHDDYFDACDFLEVDPGSEYVSGIRHTQVKPDAPPSDDWQKRAIAFCNEAKSLLWSDAGEHMRAWLNRRGLNDKTIESAGLGLNPTQGYNNKHFPKTWIARGITIPWRIEGQLWKVNIRRFDSDIAESVARGDKPNKYIEVQGGSQGLYGYDTIRADLPIVVVEGEFDRLVLLQSTNHVIACVATGSTAKGRGDKWVKALLNACPIILAFDNDKGGRDAASEWKKLIPSALRLTPWSHDVTDMVRDGFDLHDWLEDYLPVEVRQNETFPIVTNEETRAEIDRLIALYEAPPTPTKSIESQEQFETVVHAIVPDAWSVRIVPKGFTPADRVKEINEATLLAYEENRRAFWARDRIMHARPKSMEWTREQVRNKRDREAQERDEEANQTFGDAYTKRMNRPVGHIRTREEVNVICHDTCPRRTLYGSKGSWIPYGING